MKINKTNLNNVKKKITSFKNKTQMNNRNILINNNNNDLSSIQLNPPNSGKKIIFENNNSIVKYNIFKLSKEENNKIINSYYSKKEINTSFKNNLFNDKNNKNNKNNKTNKNNKVPQNNKSIKNITSTNKKPKPQYIKKKLFPYRYYLFSIFIKNIDNSEKTFCYTKKFSVVYNFICQLFDISSYLILQREFQKMKNTIIEEKQRNIIENEKKINISAKSFNLNMKECNESNKLLIFGKI